MDASAYPGKGLSLPQLVFILNQELRRTAYSPLYVDAKSFWTVKEQQADHLCSFALDTVSQLEPDILTALVTVRGWMNTFARINCIPLDILSLIPTHLSSHKDRFRANFVCRHWRRTFLQHGALWSQLFLRKGEEYVNTLLERAKGSALDIITIRCASPGTIALLPPHAQQIKHLNFSLNIWSDILMFSQVNSGSLPLLRTLRMLVVESSPDRSNMLDVPPPPLFSGAVNLKEFILDSKQAGLLNHFVFSSLTTLKLLAQKMDGPNASHLFDFLKASPTLQTVDLTIDEGTMPGSIPRGTVLVPPNVETFSLCVRNNRWQVYEPATWRYPPTLCHGCQSPASTQLVRSKKSYSR